MPCSIHPTEHNRVKILIGWMNARDRCALPVRTRLTTRINHIDTYILDTGTTWLLKLYRMLLEVASPQRTFT